jgi:ABC-type transport system substrate-binding protein
VATTTGGRAAAYAQLQSYMWKTAPHIALIYSDLTNGVSTKVRGFELFPTFVHDFWPVSLSS